MLERRLHLALREDLGAHVHQLQQLLRLAHPLEVVARSVAGRALEAAHEAAPAHRDTVSEGFDGRTSRDLLLDDVLRAQDLLVAVALLRAEHRVGALRRLVDVDEEHPRGRSREIGAEDPFDQVQRLRARWLATSGSSAGTSTSSLFLTSVIRTSHFTRMPPAPIT